MLPIQNIRGQEGEAAVDHNNNMEVEESRKLGARKKLINLEKKSPVKTNVTNIQT